MISQRSNVITAAKVSILSSSSSRTNMETVGHTIKRCKAEIKDDNVMSDGGFGGASGGGVTIGDATVAPTGNWDTPGGSNDWEGAGADSQGGAW